MVKTNYFEFALAGNTKLILWEGRNEIENQCMENKQPEEIQ